MKLIILGEYDYQTFPIRESDRTIEINESVLALIGKSLKFNKESNSIVAMTQAEIEAAKVGE